MATTLLLILTLLATALSHPHPINGQDAPIEIQEATIDGIRAAFQRGEFTARGLTEYYINRIQRLNPTLNAIVEVNREALSEAEALDRAAKERRSWGRLEGIPVVVKDNIATKDGMGTAAGSAALVGAVVAREGAVVEQLRKGGAVIVGKGSMTEWGGFRSRLMPDGWSALSGQGHNPYNLSQSPGGSSSGPAIAVAANLAIASVGTETDGSVLSPASLNSVVGIKPTVGLTSRAGVIPLISHRQGSLGVMARTVTDAVYVLDTVVGNDPNDAVATRKASRYIPPGGYPRFLNPNGLNGKRIGIVRHPFFLFPNGSSQAATFQQHFYLLRQKGAILVDNLEIENIEIIMNNSKSGEVKALLAEFKQDLNAYLQNDLRFSPVRSLADVISFNQKFSLSEKIKEYDQANFLAAEATNGTGKEEQDAIENLARLSRNGFERLMRKHRLDAMVAPSASAARVLAIGGFPGITVPAGYDSHTGLPFGLCFGGLRGTEPTLIEITFAFEQATKIRKPPSNLT